MKESKESILSMVIGALLFVLLMQGCSQKDEALFQKVEKNAPLLNTLQHTQKAIFHQGDENETVLLVTHLPDKERKSELFIVAGTPDTKVTPEFLKTITIGGKKILSVKKISRNSLPAPIRKHTPSWFVTYRLEAPPLAAKKFPMSITLDGESRTLYFYKGPKYLIDRVPYKSF